MKDTILDGVHGWSAFQPDRRIDFCAWFWRRPGGNVMFDPLPLDESNARFVEAAGGVACVLLTNADHWRGTSAVVDRFGAKVCAPSGDRERFEARAERVDVWFDSVAQLPCGLDADLELRLLHGGKSPVEAAFWLKPVRGLYVGDAVRSHVSGVLRLLPDDKLADRARLCADLATLRDLNLQALLLGDGDSFFCGARGAFLAFLRELESAALASRSTR
jgi:glyoxylase-like metal-dependent hydrolase (beta-lactamase superfamily II)